MSEESAPSKLDTMSTEDLKKLVKKYMILQKQLKTKNEELTNKLDNYEKNRANVETRETQNETETRLNNEIENLKIKLEESQVRTSLLEEEKKRSKEQNESLANEIDELKRSIEQHEKFKEEMQTSMENAQREISLNKSMLEMLNNEIQMLSSEKLQLEKKLITIRRNTTPSIIVEEDEEDLKEDENGISDHINRGPLEGIHEQPEDMNGDRHENLRKKFVDNDVAFLKDQSNLESLNKQIEEMTFFIDELKSELEAEREKSHEYLKELEVLRNYSAEHETVDKHIKITENLADNTTSSSSNLFRIAIEKMIRRLNGEDLVLDSDENSKLNAEDKQILDNLSTIFNEIKEKQELLVKEETDKVKYLESQMEKVIKNFKSEIELLESQLQTKSTESAETKQKLESKIKSLQAELDSEKEKAKEVKKKAEKIEKEVSKNKMLDLEIADYERSIKALNTQLINKDKEIVDMKNEVSQTNEKLSQFKAEKESTEKEKEQLEEKCIKLKELLIKAQKELADVKQSETERLSSDASQKAQLQTLTIEIENYKLQITEMSVERVKIQEKLHFIQENNQRNANLLEAKILSLTNELENSNSRYTQLQSDYENYKVKAQNAFKKQKESTETNSNAINSGDIQRYLAEIEQLKSGVNKLKEKLETTEERLQIVEKENDYVQEEYSRCLERNTKLMTELKEKEVEWKNKLQETVKESSIKENEAIELIQSLKLQNEELANSYKEKFKQLNTQSAKSIDLLQSQLEEARDQVDKLNKQLSDEVKNRSLSPTLSFSSNQFGKGLVEERTHNEISSNHSNSNSNNTVFIEDLLASNDSTNTKFASQTSFQKIFDSDSNMISMNDYEEVKSNLGKSKLQLSHLNEILNESELNNARLNEQISLLKEEIRRLERNQEREKSISNMEYLKNIIMKFLTFSSQQEKAQLLPVLTTMLKLSQEEQTAIMNAKVYGNLKNGNTTTANSNEHSPIQNLASGWTNYLPKWT